ncbi:hypothetical protein [Rhizobium binxianense]
MTALLEPLRFLARHGRMVLVVGLLAGVGLPDLAAAMRPYIPEMVVVMLFAAALRIGIVEVLGRLRDMRSVFGMLFLYQVVLPYAAALVLMAIGVSGPLATALVLVLTASPISGSPNLTLMTGHDPAPALRMLIAGTAVLPLTVLPVFSLWPAFGHAGTVFYASLHLLLLIGCSAGLAFAIRHFLLPRPGIQTLQAIDGFSALIMAVAVIGLMSALGPALRATPSLVAVTLLAAFAVNFGLQLAAFAIFSARNRAAPNVGYSIIAGNRNVMLFIAALPAVVTEPLLLFIACYQVPMYLTPILLDRLYRARAATPD